MQLNFFDGGISKRLDPSLININEAVEYSNIDNTSGLLKSCKDLTDANQEVRGYFYKYKNLWLSSFLERTYIEYKDFLYYTEKDRTAKKFDGVTETLLGIVGPTVKLTTVETAPVDTNVISTSPAVMQYVYTYYNSQYGIESQPSPLSDELTLAANKIVTISGFVASADPQVDKIRIYRIGDSITVMTLVKTVNNTSANVVDDLLTLELPGSVLDTYDNGLPPLGAKYLTESYGILFCALGDKLYFSKIGKPNAWPGTNVIDFANEITGIRPVANGILVFSLTTTDILLGTKITDFSVLPVSIEQGCISHSSCKAIKSLPVWVSLEGVCTYSSGIVEVISKDKLDTISLNIVNTAVINEQYFMCLADGSLLVMDVRFGRIFKSYLFSKKLSNILASDNVLYGSVLDRLHTLFTGEDIALKYVSPVFTEGNHSVTKLYNIIYFSYDGEFEVRANIDGQEVAYAILKDKKVEEFKIPANKQTGSDIQLVISGIGVVKEIEWKVVGRNNGR